MTVKWARHSLAPMRRTLSYRKSHPTRTLVSCLPKPPGRLGIRRPSRPARSKSWQRTSVLMGDTQQTKVGETRSLPPRHRDSNAQ
jgi:hypothetical protein